VPRRGCRAAQRRGRPRCAGQVWPNPATLCCWTGPCRGGRGAARRRGRSRRADRGWLNPVRCPRGGTDRYARPPAAERRPAANDARRNNERAKAAHSVLNLAATGPAMSGTGRFRGRFEGPLKAPHTVHQGQTVPANEPPRASGQRQSTG